jgi:hypothetical protein
MIFSLILLIFFCKTLACQASSHFLKLPLETQLMIFEYSYESPTQFVATISRVNEQFYQVVAQLSNGKPGLLTTLLINADRSINFQYHPNKAYNNRQTHDYYKCPFTSRQKVEYTNEWALIEHDSKKKCNQSSKRFD